MMWIEPLLAVASVTGCMAVGFAIGINSTRRHLRILEAEIAALWDALAPGDDDDPEDNTELQTDNVVAISRRAA